jgi:hypothetical protein
VARLRTVEETSRSLVDRLPWACVRLGGTGYSALRTRAFNGGTARLGARGRWRIGRQPVRPVLKHGPRSLTCARVVGRYETLRRNESEGTVLPAWVGSSAVRGRRAPPARLTRIVGEAEQERTRWDPKDGELCLSRTKPEETLVEVRSDSDVQIDRQTWV